MRIRACFFFVAFFASLALVQPACAKPIYTGLFGQYLETQWNDVLETVSRHHFQIVLGGTSRTLLDEAQKKGVKVIVMLLPSKQMLTDEDSWHSYLTELRNVVSTYKDHPAVLAWMPLDEPDGKSISIDKIKTIRSVILAQDKTHPTFTVLTNPTRWFAYLPYFDIISVDPYLSEDKFGVRERPEKVGEYIRKVQRDLRKLKMNKPVWVTLGAFELRYRTDPTKMNPFGFVKATPDEFRAMVDISLQNRVDGILVYTLSFIKSSTYEDWNLINDDPLLWNAVKEIPQKTLQ